jgi:hypothetical protein
VPAVAIRAQDTALGDFRDQIRAAAQIREYGHFTTFVAQMVELQDYRV